MSGSVPSNSLPVNSHLPAWRQWASAIGCWILGAVFLIAAWGKSLTPAAFADQVHYEGLDFLLPASVVALIALALEWLIGFALLLVIRHRWLLTTTSALVAFFLFLTGRAYWRFLATGELPEAGCGCFGSLIQRTPGEAFWQDILLMVPPLLLAWLAAYGGRLPRWRTAIALTAAAIMTIFAWQSPNLPLDDLATNLKPAVKVADICVGSADDGTQTCFDAIVPELDDGEHLVVLADVEDPALIDRVEQLNERFWDADAPPLWVVSGATSEQMFRFKFGHGPTFDIREAPGALLDTMNRRLPRSFRTRDGVVVETFDGLPPEILSAGQPDH